MDGQLSEYVRMDKETLADRYVEEEGFYASASMCKQVTGDDFEGVMIPVEKIKGKMLLIGGTEDLNLDFEHTVENIKNRLREFGKEKQCAVLSFPGAGHLIEPPHAPLCRSVYFSLLDMCLGWGGRPREHARAQEKSWEHIKEFLNKNVRHL